jgi:hypothetical protein
MGENEHFYRCPKCGFENDGEESDENWDWDISASSVCCISCKVDFICPKCKKISNLVMYPEWGTFKKADAIKREKERKRFI